LRIVALLANQSLLDLHAQILSMIFLGAKPMKLKLLIKMAVLHAEGNVQKKILLPALKYNLAQLMTSNQ
jgi:hypothetical protein